MCEVRTVLRYTYSWYTRIRAFARLYVYAKQENKVIAMLEQRQQQQRWQRQPVGGYGCALVRTDRRVAG